MNSAPKKPSLRRPGWVNVFPDSLGIEDCYHASGVFPTRAAALKAAGQTCLDTVKIRYRPAQEVRP